MRHDNLSTILLLSLVCLSVTGCRSFVSLPPDIDATYIITTSAAVVLPRVDPANEWKNFYGICWNGSAASNIRYAKAMGYKFLFFHPGMENDRRNQGLRFFLETPCNIVNAELFGSATLDPDRTYSPEAIAQIERFFAWKSTAPFPGNIATGWFFNKRIFTPQPDFQQQAVIDYYVQAIIDYAKSLEDPQRDFLFAGVAWDVSLLTGDFWDGQQSAGGNQRTLAYWTGKDSSVLHSGIQHEYATYTEGKAAYYKTVMRKLREAFPHQPIKFIMEPYRLFPDWCAQLQYREDRRELMPDFLSEEGPELGFARDHRVVDSGLIARDSIGCTTPNIHDLEGNLQIAALAAIQGSWFNWYGRFSGTGDNYPMDDISQVPAWLKLVRAGGNWDNLWGVPLGQRTWDGTSYNSPNTHFGSHVLYSRNPYNGAIYAVFLDDKGTIALNPGETVISVTKTDSSFNPRKSAPNEVYIDGSTLRLVPKKESP